jgi:hypothetical protein
MQAVYEPDKWRGFHPEAKGFWKFFEAAWQVSHFTGISFVCMCMCLPVRVFG